MKTTEIKLTSARPQQHPQQAGAPFFQEAGEDAFYLTAPKQPEYFFSKPTLQPKLTINQPNTPYEQEADHMAEKVVNNTAIQATAAPPPPIQRQGAACGQEEELQTKMNPGIQQKPIFESEAMANPDLQMKCAACEAEEEEGMVQGKQMATGAEGSASSSLESTLSASKVGGSPLPENTRSQMEGAIGADFSGVRVHTDSSAVQMNKELGAQAFTHGSDVYFNLGKYDTGSTEGKRLLGHELTHVVQQGGKDIQMQTSCTRFQSQSDLILASNPRRYSSGVGMYRYVVQRGETFSRIAERILSQNRVDLAGQLSDELVALNQGHITDGRPRAGDCVVLIRGWAHPNVGILPAAPTTWPPVTNVRPLSPEIKSAIATIYSEQWNTGTNSQEQQRYIWYSIRLRIQSSQRGSTLNSVLNPREYHGMSEPLYQNAMAELNAGNLRSQGLINAYQTVRANYSNSIPTNAGLFYFHWVAGHTPDSCFNSAERREARRLGRAPNSPELSTIERQCAWDWAQHLGFVRGLPASQGWHRKISSDSGSRIQSMYIYRG